MNKKQFSKVLKIAMKYYSPYTKDINEHCIYMCHAIRRAYWAEEISEWESKAAKNKINEMLVYRTLRSYLQTKLGIENISCTMRMDFWKQHIIGEIE